jgi:hypothetical protein
VPIVPVALSYEREDAAWVGDTTFISHYARTMVHACTRVSVEFLPPLSLGRTECPRTPQQLADDARRSITRAIARNGDRTRTFPVRLADADLAFSA